MISEEYSSVFRGRRIGFSTMSVLLENFCIMQTRLIFGSMARTPRVCTMFIILNKNRSVRQILLSTSLLGYENGERECMRKCRLLDHPDLQSADTARQERGRRFRVLDRLSDKLTPQESKEYARLKGSFKATASWCCAEAPLFASLRRCRIRSKSRLEI
jgi:hypothetical protein